MTFNSSSIFPHPWIVMTLSILLAFIITWFLIPRIVYTSKLKNLSANSNGRTLHKKPVPNLGGVAVFTGFVLPSIVFAGPYFEFELQYIVCGLIIVFFIGIKDDITISNSWKKLIGQVIAATTIILLADIRINDFYGLLGINQIHYIPSIIVTCFVFLVIINGFNLIDGIDGLASGVGLVTSSSLGLWFWIIGSTGYAILSFSLASSLSVFFYFNVFGKTNKLFLGDTGSLVIGFIMSVLTIRFLQLDLNVNGIGYIQSAPAVAIGILIIPLFDTLRVFILRLLQGKSPFVPDRQHVHHRLLQLGNTHLQATLILLTVNLLFIVLAYQLRGIGVTWLTILILGLASLMSYLIVIYAKRRVKIEFDSGYIVEGTWKRRIRRLDSGRTRHINNFTLKYPNKVNNPEKANTSLK